MPDRRLCRVGRQTEPHVDAPLRSGRAADQVREEAHHLVLIAHRPDDDGLHLPGAKVAGIGEPGFDNRSDFNGDGLITASDFILMKLNFGQGGTPPLNPPGGNE